MIFVPKMIKDLTFLFAIGNDLLTKTHHSEIAGHLTSLHWKEEELIDSLSGGNMSIVSTCCETQNDKN